MKRVAGAMPQRHRLSWYEAARIPASAVGAAGDWPTASATIATSGTSSQYRIVRNRENFSRNVSISAIPYGPLLTRLCEQAETAAKRAGAPDHPPPITRERPRH